MRKNLERQQLHQPSLWQVLKITWHNLAQFMTHKPNSTFDEHEMDWYARRWGTGFHIRFLSIHEQRAWLEHIYRRS